VKARRALADSSYGGPDALPEITWYYGEGNSEAEAEARWFAEQYRAVLGIELSLVPLADDEWDPLYESAESWPQLSTNGWFGAYPDPQYWLSVVWTCDSTAHASRVGYCNPELDALLQRADAEQDATARIALYEEAGRMLVEDVPSIFMLNWAEAVLVKPEVTGFAMTVMDHWPGWTTPLTIDVERSP
jgi:ABC-type transport system substrate-binding protein